MTKAANLSALGSNVTTAGNISSETTLTLQTNSTTALTIDTSQNVGIGTASPSTKLNIYDASLASVLVQSDSTTNVIVHRASTDTSAGSLAIRKARGTIASSSAVASGDTAGQLLYQAFGGTNNRNVANINGIVDTYTSDTNISGYLSFATNVGSTNTTERMRITSAGNVGIGTASPTAGYKLDVNGNFKVAGSIDENVYAVVDAAGVPLSPQNGTIQTWTLGASRTPTAGTWDAGESMTLMINDGTAFTVTWTTLGVVWVGGTAPTLATTGFTVIELWKVSTTIYGALVGNVA
jgi:hypothetical protein